VANGNRVVLVAVGVVLAASSIATAQRWGSEPTPRDGACFYEHSDYRGDYFCVGAGESLATLPEEMNDSISSLRLFGRAEVTVFSGYKFTGSSARFDDDERNLREERWNNRISSLRVQRADRDRDHDRGRWHDGGSSRRRDEDLDRIIRRVYRDVLDREPDEDGFRLYRRHMLDDDWNEEQLRDALRKSPEYHQGKLMTREKAEAIVRSAYLSVLRREPDSGSRSYVEKVLHDKWTQQDVESELRKSSEYRKRDR